MRISSFWFDEEMIKNLLARAKSVFIIVYLSKAPEIAFPCCGSYMDLVE